MPQTHVGTLHCDLLSKEQNDFFFLRKSHKHLLFSFCFGASFIYFAVCVRNINSLLSFYSIISDLRYTHFRITFIVAQFELRHDIGSDLGTSSLCGYSRRFSGWQFCVVEYCVHVASENVLQRRPLAHDT